MQSLWNWRLSLIEFRDYIRKWACVPSDQWDESTGPNVCSIGLWSLSLHAQLKCLMWVKEMVLTSMRMHKTAQSPLNGPWPSFNEQERLIKLPHRRPCCLEAHQLISSYSESVLFDILAHRLKNLTHSPWHTVVMQHIKQKSLSKVELCLSIKIQNKDVIIIIYFKFHVQLNFS